MDTATLYPCPCCGYKTLNAKPPGTYLICPICCWEDDGDATHEWGYSWGGSNNVSLRQAQRNFIAFGACEREWLDYVRRPTASDVRSPDWQTIDTLAENALLALIEQITAAFDGVTREDGITLHEARALDDYADTKKAREIDYDRRWQDVPDEWLEKFDDVFPFFDPKGFRYYIPAYMIWCLKNYNTSNSNSLHSTIYALHYAKRYYRSHFRLLNEAQLQAVSKFLRFMDT